MSSDSTLVGNLTNAPELRFAKSGTAWATFSVAVNRGDKDNRTTSYFDCKAFGDLAEALAELGKGQRVIVKGYFQQENWESKEGGKRSKHVLTVNDGGPSLRWGTGERSGPPQRGGGKQYAKDDPERPFTREYDEESF